MPNTSLSRREFLHSASAIPVAGLGLPSLRAAMTQRARERSPLWNGYGNAIVIDALGSPGPFNVPNSLDQPLSDDMVANARQSGITAINVTISSGGPGHESFDNTVRAVAYWERELTAHPDVLMKVQSVADLQQAKDTRRFGLIYGFQDTTMLEGDLERVDLFHNFGVRIVQLTYNVRNLAGDGCLEPDGAGLSRFGHSLVERLDEKGIVVDLSHCCAQTTIDAIRASSNPVAITHSGCSAVFDHPRSKSDDILRQLADKGGVIGIYLMPFLNPSGPATADDVVRHIEHAVNVCGEDHVGIGSDQSTTPIELTPEYRHLIEVFSERRQRLGIAAPREDELLFVPEINSPRRMEMIADLLLRRGHGEARVEKIVGGNFKRLFADVWR